MKTRLLIVLVCSLVASVAPAQVIPETTAQRAGLSRAWFALATQDAPASGVADAAVHGDTVYVLGGSGLLTAYDAEAGFVRWSTRIGSPGQPVFGPSVHDVINREGEVEATRCGVISGSDLHVIDAASGEFVLSRRLVGAPGGAPAITTTHAYVPQLQGVMIGYPFDTLRGLQRRVASPGRLLAAPALTPERLVWSTDRGDLYAASSRTGRASYRFDTEAPVVGTPSVADDLISFANREGVVFGLDPKRGSPKWRTTLGASIDLPVVSVDDLVLVADQTPTIHALDASTGAELWRVEGLSQFVAASASRVYAVTPKGALGVLDRATGKPVGSWPAIGTLRPVVNTETDRLFLISESGMLHCFHETGSQWPYRHRGTATPPLPEEIAAAPGAEVPAAAQPAAQPQSEEDPFGGGSDSDPFGSGDPFGSDEPADTPDEEEEDPFGSDDPFGDEEDPFGF